MNASSPSIFNQIRVLNKPARLFLLAIFLDGLLFAGWNLFFNLYIVSAGYSRDFLGLLNAAPSLSALILAVPMGLLSDRIGRKRAMMLGFMLNPPWVSAVMVHKQLGSESHSKHILKLLTLPGKPQVSLALALRRACFPSYPSRAASAPEPPNHHFDDSAEKVSKHPGTVG